MQPNNPKTFFERVFPRTIRSQILFGFIFITLITVLGISLSTNLVNYSFSRRQMLEQLRSAQALKEIELNEWALEQQKTLLIALNDTATPERLSIVLDLARSNQYYSWYNEAVRVRLQNLVQQSQGLVDLCLVDLNGQVVLCTASKQIEGSCAQEAFFTNGSFGEYLDLPVSLKSDDFASHQFLGGGNECPITSGSEWKGTALVSRPVIDRNELLGVVVARVRPEGLIQILSNQTGLGSTGRAYLFSGRGNFLYQFGEQPMLTSTLVDHVRQTASTQPGMQNLFTGINFSPAAEPGSEAASDQRLSVYRYLPNLQAFLILEQDSTEIYKSIQINLLFSILVASIAAFTAFLLGAWITRGITKPLENLVETSSAISTGDLNRTAAVPGQVELGALARAFNSMTNQLRDLIANLEGRVSERTSALQDANTSLKNQTTRLEAGAEVGRQVTSILDLDDLLIRVVTLIRDALGYSNARVYLLKDHELVLHAFTPGIEPTYTELSLDVNSLNTLSVKTNQPVVSNNVISDPRFLEEGQPGQIGSELAIPLVVGDRILGTLDVISSQPEAFGVDDIRVIQGLADQIAIAIENAYLYQRSRELAIVEERNRLARDLHDSVLQNLYSLNLLSAGWRRQVRQGSVDNVEGYFERVGEISRQALKEMRLMVYQLHTSPLEWDGLIDALERRLAAVEGRSGQKVTLEADHDIKLPLQLENHLFMIAQEALNNILKHSNAGQVFIRLKSTGSHLRLEITDDGVGFTPETCRTGGMGLEDMRLRAVEIGGVLTIQSAPGDGTQIKLDVDMPPHGALEG